VQSWVIGVREDCNGSTLKAAVEVSCVRSLQPSVLLNMQQAMGWGLLLLPWNQPGEGHQYDPV